MDYANKPISPELQIKYMIDQWENELARILAEAKQNNFLSHPETIKLLEQAIRTLKRESNPNLAVGTLPSSTPEFIDPISAKLAKLVADIESKGHNFNPKVEKIFTQALRIAQTSTSTNQ